MTRGEIEDKVIAIIRDQKTIPDDALTREVPLADLGIDSLDALSILFAVEEAFTVTVPDDRARSIRTMDDMITVIEELLPA
jgi:acyl carrier protein